MRLHYICTLLRVHNPVSRLIRIYLYVRDAVVRKTSLKMQNILLCYAPVKY